MFICLFWRKIIIQIVAFFNYSLGNYDKLYWILNNQDWSCLFNLTCVDTAVKVLNDIITTSISQCVPYFCINRPKFPSWFSKDLIFFIKMKAKYHRRYKRSKSKHHYELFSKYRKLVKTTIKLDRMKWYTNINDNLKSNPNQFWKYVRRFTKSNNPPSHLFIDGCYVSNPAQLANAFALHFSSIHKKRDDLPAVNMAECHDYLNTFVVTDSSVLKAIRRLKPSKSSGLDGIPTFIIKGCSSILVPILTYIFNLSLSSGVFPTLWKTAAVVPVFKKGSKAEVKNYRPISILNGFSKLFEILVHEHLSFYFKEKLNSAQHGFIKSKSVVTNLVTYLNYVAPCVGSQGQCDSVYFDLSNAFDLVPHNLLISKLNCYGLSQNYIKWFRSYLSNRTFRVRLSSFLSLPHVILSGVPQGSILGPLLFVIFINDLCDRIITKHLLFADDIKLYNRISSTDDCKILQSDINAVLDWCDTNGMKINFQKTFFISFTRKTTSISFPYFYNGNNEITRISCVRDLGVMLDSKLFFHPHVDHVLSECFKMLGLIRSITYFFANIDCLISLFQCLVRSKLEFASVVWNSVTSSDSMKLERVQRKFIRLCYERFWQNRFDYNYENLLKIANFHTLHSRRLHLDALFLFNAFRGRLRCESVLEAVVFRVPSRNFREFSLFSCSSSLRLSPIFRCVRAANIISEYFDFLHKNNLVLADTFP